MCAHTRAEKYKSDIMNYNSRLILAQMFVDFTHDLTRCGEENNPRGSEGAVFLRAQLQ